MRLKGVIYLGATRSRGRGSGGGDSIGGPQRARIGQKATSRSKGDILDKVLAPPIHGVTVMVQHGSSSTAFVCSVGGTGGISPGQVMLVVGIVGRCCYYCYCCCCFRCVVGGVGGDGW